MLGLSAVLLALAASAAAWMPGTRDMKTSKGMDLFTAKNQQGDAGDLTARWLPGKLPIRGVNLGAMFIIEPWMAGTEWSNLGCGSAGSEFDCVLDLGQSTADARWPSHWSSFITESDLDSMVDYTLNTIRIPVGYWIWESLKYSR